MNSDIYRNNMKDVLNNLKKYILDPNHILLRNQYNIFDSYALIPDNVEKHLIELYGETYLTPDPKWHSGKRKNRYMDSNISILAYE